MSSLDNVPFSEFLWMIDATDEDISKLKRTQSTVPDSAKVLKVNEDNLR